MKRLEWALLCLFVGSTVSSAADRSEAQLHERFLDQLRKNRLERLVELHTSRLLASPGNLDVQLLGKLAVEYADILSRRGSLSPDAEPRRKQWKQADDRLEAYFRDHPKSGQLPLLRYQWAGQLLQRAQTTYDLSQVIENDPAPRADSLASGKKALAELTNANKAVQQILSQSNPGKDQTDALSFNQLGSLGVAIEFRIGAAWLAIARVESDAAEREKAIKESQAVLSRYTTELNAQPISLEAHLALAELYRISNRPEDAIKILFRIQELDNIGVYLQRAQLMNSEIDLAAGSLRDAMNRLNVPPEKRLAGAKWNLLLFEALLRLGSQLRATDAKESARLQNEALVVLDDLEQKYGAYWGLRGEKSLTEHGNLDQAGNNLALVYRMANVLRGQKKYAEALETYDRAVELARGEQKTDLAARLAYAAGSMLFDQEEYAKSAERLAKMSNDFPEHPLAPKALLSAAYAWAREHKKAESDSVLENYGKSLAEHAKRFPDDATAGEVHWLLAEIAERKGDRHEAIRQYRAVKPADPRYADSLEAMAGLYHDLIYGGDVDLKNRDKQIADAQLDLQTPVSGANDSEWAKGDTGPRALLTARVVLARLYCEPAVGRDEEGIEILTDATIHPALSPVISPAAWQALLIARIRRGETDKACEIAKKGFPDGESLLLEALSGLTPTAEGIEPKLREGQSQVIVAGAERLFAKPDLLTDEDRLNLNLLLAQAYFVLGKQDDAQTLLEKLQSEAPTDARILMTLAESQFAGAKYTESLKTWLKIRNGFERGEPEWFHAVLQTVRCYQKLGQADKAKKTFDTVKVLYPDLGGPQMAAKFAKVAEELASSK